MTAIAQSSWRAHAQRHAASDCAGEGKLAVQSHPAFAANPHADVRLRDPGAAGALGLSAAVVAVAKAKQIKAQGACPLCGLPPPGPDEYVVYDPNEKVCRLCFQSTTRHKTSDTPKETTL